jgi:hypothetical protein
MSSGDIGEPESRERSVESLFHRVEYQLAIYANVQLAPEAVLRYSNR